MAPLEIDEFWLGDDRVAAFYTEDPEPAGMAIQPWLPQAEKRARVLEAHGYYKRPPRGGERVCFLAPSDLAGVDPTTVSALKRVVPEMAADWIFQVWTHVRPYDDPAEIDPHEVSDYLDVPPQAVVAILQKLGEWGVLPTDG